MEKTLKVTLEQLSHHPLNQEIYKLSAIDDLVSSISEKGLLQKLIINQKFQVISGNRRFAAVKELGWKEVEVEQVQTSENEELDFASVQRENAEMQRRCQEVIDKCWD